MSTSTDNVRRRRQAKTALDAYGVAAQMQSEPMEALVTDLLSDVLHLVGATPHYLDPDEPSDPVEWLVRQLDRAVTHYRAESERSI